MKEEKVCTLEQAKKLYKIGIELKTERYWFSDVLYHSNQIPARFFAESDNIYPAPDIVELLNRLPGAIQYKGLIYRLEIVISDDIYLVMYNFTQQATHTKQGIVKQLFRHHSQLLPVVLCDVLVEYTQFYEKRSW
jgi:hypothetical protein